MKKLITLALIIGATTFTQAQSNLVFNQVILLELSNGSETTVPEGKVWKVTYGQGGNTFKVNGENWNVGVLGSHKNTPIWFPAESVFTKYIGSNSINVLNILEFNVVAISSSSGGSGGGVSADGFTAIGIVNIQFNDSRAGISNHLMGTITVPEGEIWKITDANILRSTAAFGSFNNGNYTLANVTNTFIGTHQFPSPNGGNYHRSARYLTEGSYEVRCWEVNGLNGSGSSTEYYQAMINGIKYSAN